MNNYLAYSQIALAISLGYFFLKLYLLSNKGPEKKSLTELPIVTVLIPFRNEEKNIVSCCESLIDLDYPADKIEIFLLNDSSEDESVKRAAEKVKSYNHINIIHIQEEKNNLKAKMNVLAQGAKLAKGEFIFVTDADCRPSSGWIKKSLEYFNDEIALLSGFTILNSSINSIFMILQKLDWVFLQSLAYAASNSGRPITVIGNNLVFRKKVYEELGGFEKIGFSITEDHALMKAILDGTDYNVCYVQDNEAIVESLPVKNFTAFLRQRLRWVKGGLNGNLFAYFLINSIFITHLLVIILFISGFMNYYTAIAIGLIIGVDYIFLKSNLRSLELTYLKKYFLLYEIFYFIYPVILFILIPFSKTITWKGRKYKKKGAHKQAP